MLRLSFRVGYLQNPQILKIVVFRWYIISAQILSCLKMRNFVLGVVAKSSIE